ncbi:MAG: FkbM family methyltransferase [Bradyrhizobium sp.]|uniref:FkbM family methyltransferase n=1 Tax=Bradyrhizobium sp. TaxID=376 RepID=UPI001D70AFD8|nr:FkbM family methyltransferase [Bradyrhizobium sp.]MBV9559512.1 FkbM family methyltransferase [Bradyrhizobium sp.]
MSVVRALIERAFPKLVHLRRMRRLGAREKEIKLLPLLCSDAKLAVDVGGNLGLYVHHLRKLCKGVVVFEPIPALQSYLRKQYRDVRVEGVALSDSPGHAELRMPSGIHSWATIATTNDLSLADPARLTSIEVPVRTLDSYDFAGVGILKVDVEGHEEQVLRGAVKLLSRDKPNIVVEVEERHNPGSVRRVSNLLTGLGYDGFYLHDGNLVPIAEFRIERDQPMRNVGTSGKTGRYINNFIFVASEQSPGLVSRSRPAVAHP